MRTVKSNLIKMLTIALVVCLGVFVALIPMSKTPVSADEVSFSITGDGINGAQKGLKFVGSLNGTPDDYGILVYPEIKGSVDETASIQDNADNLDAYNFIKQKEVAICFNRNTMLQWADVNDENVDEILNNFYAKDFTATPYYVVGNETFYGASYTTNMVTVAEACVDSSNTLEQAFAQEVLGYEVVNNADIEGSIEFAGREDGFIYPVAVYVNGNAVYEVEESDGETTAIDLTELVTAQNTASNVVDLRIVAEHEFDTDENGVYLRKTVCYNDANYWTSIISDVDELTAALNGKVAEGLVNYGFYKMDADITLTGALTLNNTHSSTVYHTGVGFAGVFDGAGHYIDFNSTIIKNGLFGDFAFNSNTNQSDHPMAQVTVKNLALKNYKANAGGVVLARYTLNHKNIPAGVPHFENIYVSYKGTSYSYSALLQYPGALTMKNVFVDSTVHVNNNSVANYNTSKYGMPESDKNKGFYRLGSGHVANNYSGGSIFKSMAFFKDDLSSFENVVSIGKTPLGWQAAHGWWYRNFVKHAANGDGTYTHTVGLTGFSQDYNEYVVYAGNETVGNVMRPTGIKENFLKLVEEVPGTTYLAGAYCAKCYNQFSLDNSGAAVCPDCQVTMTKTGANQDTDLWAQPAIYTWGTDGDITNLQNPTYDEQYFTGGRYRLEGTYKYNSLDDLSSKFLKDNTYYDSFLGDAGNNMWKVNEKGELAWHSFVDSNYVFTPIDFDASTGEIVSTKIASYDEVTSIIANGNELTKENGGIIKTENGYKLNVLANGSVDTNGVPYIDAKSYASNMFVLTVNTEDESTSYANVRYWTSIISDAAELKSALDFTYTSTAKYNYGFFTMDADVNMAGVSFDYAGFAAGNVNVEIGFGGQFDGRGYAIENVDGVMTNGLFGNFVYAGGAANSPKARVTIKNLEIKNWGRNSDPILGKYTSNHNYHANASITIENIYVTYKSAAVIKGLIKTPGTASTIMNNVVVVNPNTPDNFTRNDAMFGEGTNGNTMFATKPFYAEGTLFGSLRHYGSNTQLNINNVISISKSPLVYQTADIADWSSNIQDSIYKTFFTNTVDGGVYTHTVKTTGFDFAQTFIVGEMYVGYAGNDKVGNVLNITGIRPSFAAIAATSDGSAVAGYYCANCYDYYSLEAGNCPNCVVDDAPVALTEKANLWTCLGVYTYARTNLDGYVNPTSTQHNGEVVFTNVLRYDDVAAMKTAYETDNSIYASFLGEAGNKMWSVVEGVLTWVGA
ncbi:MAG: hypothetical protein E7358_04735 [Clostridiales bacterium]|nr:hypothetical protein [Clostridiales bacterium]